MHYEHFKQRDPSVLKALIESFPFATLIVNGPDRPIVAHPPLTFKQSITVNGVVEFHLAKVNPIISHLQNGAKLTITLNGPSAPISPSWYTGPFRGDKPDRSKMAPTYNYINASLMGAVQIMDMEHLTAQISDLITANEPENGWEMKEIDPVIFNKWRDMIVGFRMPIETFDLTAKLSQNQNPADKPGIIEGLQKRSTASDVTMAHMLEIFDGTPESLIKALHFVSGRVRD